MEVGIYAIENRLQAILESLKWSKKKLLPTFCNTNLPTKKKSSLNFYENAEYDLLWPESLPVGKSITLDLNALKKLLNKPKSEVPQKFSELQLNFNREEKLKMYEHVLKSCPTILNTSIALYEQETFFKEIVAKQKFEKNGKHMYRTIRLTYVEEMRNVVKMQMRSLQQFLRPKMKELEIIKSKNVRKSSRSRIKCKGPTLRRGRIQKH